MAQPFIAILSSEMSPYSKVGGLGDVVNALPKHLHRIGQDVCVVIPYYKFMNDQNLVKELVGEATIPFLGRDYAVKFLKTTLSDTAPLPVYFIYQDELFSQRDKVYSHSDDPLRWAFFNYAIFHLFEHLGRAPDVLHCQDWETGLVPNYLKFEFGKSTFWKNTVTVFTIHNLLYQMQGMWYDVPLKKRDRGRGAPPTNVEGLQHTNFTLRAIKNADIINTVSERYAQEILTKKFGEGLDGFLRRRRSRVFGIINGIDYTVFNPSLDQHLDIHYDWNSLDKKQQNKRKLQQELGLSTSGDMPLIGMVHRLTEQKGIQLVMDVFPTLVNLPVQIVFVGPSDRAYMKNFRAMARRYPQQIAVYLEFSEAMGSRVYAGSDMFLMPSRYEPCGISQLISLRYGSIPIVHRVGGLADTIGDFDPKTGTGTGFVFNSYTPRDFLVSVVRATETYKYSKVWEHLTWQAMRQSFSWELPARKYLELYMRALRLRHALD